MTLTPAQWEAFLREVVDRLNTYYRDETMVDVSIFLGRHDKQTGDLLPPRLEVREHVRLG